MAQDSKMTKEEHAELKAKMQKAAGEETIDRVMKKLNVDAIVGTMEMVLVGFASLAGMFRSNLLLKLRGSAGVSRKVLIQNLDRISMRDDATRYLREIRKTIWILHHCEEA